LVRSNANFRFLWFGQIVSLLGDWFNLIASASLIATLTESGMALGGLFALRMIAPFLISPLAGIAADRYDRKKLLILTDIGRAVVVLGFLMVKDAGDVWLLYVLTVMQLSISGFFFPARSAILPNLVSTSELGAANALTSATWSVMLAFGTALGGLVAGAFGVYIAFLVDALSFLVSALLLARIRFSSTTAADHKEASLAAALREYVDGLKYLWEHLDVLAIVLHKGALAFTTSGAMQVILVALADRVFVIGKAGGIGMGIMFAVVGVGTGIGPIMARRYTGDEDRPLRVTIAISYLMMALGLALAATLHNFAIVLAGILLRGLGGGILWVFSTQLIMQLVPDEVRGRVFGMELALFTLMAAISSGLSGWSIDSPIGIGGTLWCMAGLCLIPAVFWGLYVRRAGGFQDSGVVD
jgi:MFS family permease